MVERVTGKVEGLGSNPSALPFVSLDHFLSFSLVFGHGPYLLGLMQFLSFTPLLQSLTPFFFSYFILFLFIYVI